MKKKVFLALIALIIICSIIIILYYNGILLFNNPSNDKYPVRGVDVSSYQGQIDWNTLSEQNIDFAFIKATEGSSFQDKYFSYNWENAMETNLKVGAYHFFSYDSSGRAQAENFIKTVTKTDKMLPPVIDIEFYADKEANLPDKKSTQEILSELLTILEQHYDLKPIIYATEKSYKEYIADAYADYDIWIRNVVTEPTLSDKRQWTFWQYTNRERLDGYSGKERFIDMNVFNGTKDEFNNRY